MRQSQASGRFRPGLLASLIALSLSAASAALTLLAAPAGAKTHPFDVHDLVAMSRVSDLQVSPDGRWIVYVLRTTDLEANLGRSDLWLVPVSGESAPRRLTTHPESDSNPRWSPEGDAIYFLSGRSGSSQVWRLALSGGEAQRVSDLPLDVANLMVSPDGRHLAFSLEVFADCPEIACTAKRLAEREASNRTGVVYDSLFVRHWDTWKDHRRSQLFIMPSAGGDPVSVTKGIEGDVPSKPFGGTEEIAFAPDGENLVVTARVAGNREAWSTDFNLYSVSLSGKGRPRRMTPNSGWDTHPVFSPDGKTLAYASMDRAGFEADRLRIVLRDWPAGRKQVLTLDWDRSARDFFFSSDSRTLFVTAHDRGEVPIFAIDIETKEVRTLVRGGVVSSPALAGDRLVFGLETLAHPADIYTAPVEGPAGEGSLRQITHVNQERLAKIRFGEFEQFSFAGWNEETVYGWIVKPVDFDAKKKYPIAFLIHGGPQGSWLNQFHYRWNAQTYAGAGYAAILIDFHGSTGYGQAFTDSISGDWGGKPLEDLEKGLAAALGRYPWLDAERACALGASYGGYMINWLAGHWNAETAGAEFRCLVNHDGLFDLRSMYYSTEELWFPEWELRGTPWENPEMYDKWNPALFVERWKTPMLVVHGELDYRVPIGQGLQTFTALQRRGIPSRLLYFPDENHWVLKPHNSVQWHESVLAWLDRWAGEK